MSAEGTAVSRADFATVLGRLRESGAGQSRHQRELGEHLAKVDEAVAALDRIAAGLERRIRSARRSRLLLRARARRVSP